MKKLLPFVIAIGLAVPAGASGNSAPTASPSGEPAALAPTGAEAPKKRLVCKSTAVIGSRVSRTRECRTAEEWDKAAQSTQRELRNRIDRGFTGER